MIAVITQKYTPGPLCSRFSSANKTPRRSGHYVPIVRVNVPRRFHPLATLNSPGLEVSGLGREGHVPARSVIARGGSLEAKERERRSIILSRVRYIRSAENDIDLSVYNKIESVQHNRENSLYISGN